MDAGCSRRSGIQLSDGARQHPLFPMLDYIAKNSYKQSQAIQEVKSEIRTVRDAVTELKHLVDKLQDEGSLNIHKYKVRH